MTDLLHDSGPGHDAEDARWAYGTGFTDPFAGLDTTVPDDVDAAVLAAYCLGLADDALVLAQRLGEWCSRAPDLEEDVALANIALDLLGQARLLLVRVAAADPSLVPAMPEGSPLPAEDALAFFRDAADYRNVRLAEQPTGDFAATMARLLLLAGHRLAVMQRLRTARDPMLAAIAGRAVHELAYHRDHAARWVVILAQGTEESRRRLQAGLATVWPWREELVAGDAVARAAAADGTGADVDAVAGELDAVLGQVLDAAGLSAPDVPSAGPVAGGRGREGRHTEALGPLLAEMQVVARAHPQGRW